MPAMMRVVVAELVATRSVARRLIYGSARSMKWDPQLLASASIHGKTYDVVLLEVVPSGWRRSQGVGRVSY